ncbi:MAG: hypothetical protein ACPGN3_07300 [Opitutales bacterium]
MFRIKLALIIGGGVLAFLGFQEFTVSQTASLPAYEVELSELEESTELPNNYIKVGTHWSVYGGAIYEYELAKGSSDGPNDSSKVNYCYYPVVSNTHPYVVTTDQLFEKFGGPENVPEAAWPEFKQFSVLVKTKRFDTIGSIPDDWLEAETIEGLVINRIASLDAEEEGLLRQSFPSINLDHVLILEEGRQPSPASTSFGMMGGGSALALLGLVWIVRPKRKQEA